MNKHYLLWATGQDKPGIVADVTEILFKNRCNLEDSSMMRLGSEFAMFLIFSCNSTLFIKNFDKKTSVMRRRHKLNLGFKPLSQAESKFKPIKSNPFIVSVHGLDKPGIVYHVTKNLKNHKFNITDLTTHRTHQRGHAGYILFIEGEIKNKKSLPALKKSLHQIGKKLKTQISIQSTHLHQL